MTFDYEKEPRRPNINVTVATRDLVKFTLTNTDVSVANAVRRIMLAEVPTLAIEIVNIEENETVLFDEFIAHRMGLLPLSSHGIGDIPPDEKEPGGFVEHKDCNCFDGCQYCTVEYKLDVHNAEDQVLNVTHFDLVDTGRFRRDVDRESGGPPLQPIRPCPFPNPDLDTAQDRHENGIILAKLKKDQHLKMTCHARKGIPKYHSKFAPTATTLYQYQPIIRLEREDIDSLTLDQKVDFIQACPRKVFEMDIEDKIEVKNLMSCHFCDECIAKAREFGKRGMVEVTQDLGQFHFTVEGVTADGPRSMIDVVRAAFRVLDYKLSLFLKDCYDDDIEDWLPKKSTATGSTA